MTNVTLLLYRARGKVFDKLIRWWTGSRYSHCELLFEDGSMISADSWGYKKVRYTTGYNPDNWDKLTISMQPERVKILREWCDRQVGKGYDWTGVVRFVLPFVPQLNSRWFCSELCGAALRYVGVLPYTVDVHGLSPGGLARALTSSGKVHACR